MGQSISTRDLPEAWERLIDAFFDSQVGQTLSMFLDDRAAGGAVIYPPDPFRAVRLLAPKDVRVVILGQDPYHGPGQACGMAFSVPQELSRLPPSLRNIYKELSREYGCDMPKNGDISFWANDGVLLLNTVLTVEEGRPASHARHGWEELTDAMLRTVLNEPGAHVLMLWGNHAQAKESVISDLIRDDTLILRANHPSPLSALRPPIPFIGCGHFRTANEWLTRHGLPAVRWIRSGSGLV